MSSRDIRVASSIPSSWSWYQSHQAFDVCLPLSLQRSLQSSGAWKRECVNERRRCVSSSEARSEGPVCLLNSLRSTQGSHWVGEIPATLVVAYDPEDLGRRIGA